MAGLPAGIVAALHWYAATLRMQCYYSLRPLSATVYVTASYASFLAPAATAPFRYHLSSFIDTPHMPDGAALAAVFLLPLFTFYGCWHGLLPLLYHCRHDRFIYQYRHLSVTDTRQPSRRTARYHHVLNHQFRHATNTGGYHFGLHLPRKPWRHTFIFITMPPAAITTLLRLLISK